MYRLETQSPGRESDFETTVVNLVSELDALWSGLVLCAHNQMDFSVCSIKTCDTSHRYRGLARLENRMVEVCGSKVAGVEGRVNAEDPLFSMTLLLDFIFIESHPLCCC